MAHKPTPSTPLNTLDNKPKSTGILTFLKNILSGNKEESAPHSAANSTPTSDQASDQASTAHRESLSSSAHTLAKSTASANASTSSATSDYTRSASSNSQSSAPSDSHPSDAQSSPTSAPTSDDNALTSGGIATSISYQDSDSKLATELKAADISSLIIDKVSATSPTDYFSEYGVNASLTLTEEYSSSK